MGLSEEIRQQIFTLLAPLAYVHELAVAHQLFAKSDLAAVAMTSKAFKESVYPVLWRDANFVQFIQFIPDEEKLKQVKIVR